MHTLAPGTCKCVMVKVFAEIVKVVDLKVGRISE